MQMPTEFLSCHCRAPLDSPGREHIIFHYLKLAENNIARSILVQMENYSFKTFIPNENGRRETTRRKSLLV